MHCTGSVCTVCGTALCACKLSTSLVRCMREQEMASKSGTGAPLLGGGSEVKPLLGSGEKESGASARAALPFHFPFLCSRLCGGRRCRPRRIAPPAVVLFTARASFERCRAANACGKGRGGIVSFFFFPLSDTPARHVRALLPRTPPRRWRDPRQVQVQRRPDAGGQAARRAGARPLPPRRALRTRARALAHAPCALLRRAAAPRRRTRRRA